MQQMMYSAQATPTLTGEAVPGAAAPPAAPAGVNEDQDEVAHMNAQGGTEDWYHDLNSSYINIGVELIWSYHTFPFYCH